VEDGDTVSARSLALHKFLCNAFPFAVQIPANILCPAVRYTDVVSQYFKNSPVRRAVRGFDVWNRKVTENSILLRK
jgi:hypothetical protein